jgi:hypothetical protein
MVKIITDYDINQCIDILNEKINQSFLFGEMKIEVKGLKVIIRRRVYNAFKNTFIGEFTSEGAETVIVGKFKVDKVPIFLKNAAITMLIIVFLFNFLYFVKKQVDFSSIFNLTFILILIVSVIVISAGMKKNGLKDQEIIVNRLKELLKAKDYSQKLSDFK